MQICFTESPPDFPWDETEPLPHLLYSQAETLIPSDDLQRSRRLNSLKEYLSQGGCLLVETGELNQSLISRLELLKRDLHLRPVDDPHPMLRRPFLFHTWPHIPSHPMELYWDDGVLVAVGNLVNLWNGNQLDRTTIREVHEWGINLLHYVWQRHHFQQLLI
jgi:hypothetical protein